MNSKSESNLKKTAELAARKRLYPLIYRVKPRLNFSVEAGLFKLGIIFFPEGSVMICRRFPFFLCDVELVEVVFVAVVPELNRHVQRVN
jgi:hypothetical protein